MARPRGIRKAQADAVLLLACLDSLHTAQLHSSPLFPYSCNIIAIRPKLTAPQISFQIWLLLEQFSRCNTFENPNNLTRCNFRMCRTKYMYVVFVTTYLLKLDVVSIFYLFCSHHNDSYNRLV